MPDILLMRLTRSIVSNIDMDTDKRIRPGKGNSHSSTASKPLNPIATKNNAFHVNNAPLSIPSPLQKPPSPTPEVIAGPRPLPPALEHIAMDSPPSQEVKTEEAVEMIKQEIMRQTETAGGSISRSNSGSPAPGFVRFPTPTSLGGGTGGESEGTPPPAISLLSIADNAMVSLGGHSNAESSADSFGTLLSAPNQPTASQSVKKRRKKKHSSPSLPPPILAPMELTYDEDVVDSPLALEEEILSPLQI
ncbi:hypothetical protein BG004_001780, partial [Podila humilis]